MSDRVIDFSWIKLEFDGLRPRVALREPYYSRANTGLTVMHAVRVALALLSIGYAVLTLSFGHSVVPAVIVVLLLPEIGLIKRDITLVEVKSGAQASERNASRQTDTPASRADSDETAQSPDSEVEQVAKEALEAAILEEKDQFSSKISYVKDGEERHCDVIIHREEVEYPSDSNAGTDK